MRTWFVNDWLTSSARKVHQKYTQEKFDEFLIYNECISLLLQRRKSFYGGDNGRSGEKLKAG